jgi:hypothetical protein
LRFEDFLASVYRRFIPRSGRVPYEWGHVTCGEALEQIDTSASNMAIEAVTRLRDYEFDLEEKLTTETDCTIQKDMVVYEIMLKSRFCFHLRISASIREACGC